MISLSLGLLFLLLLFSIFFSASETALVSLSPQKAKTLALRTPVLASAVHGWLARPHELLTMILVGNTFVNILFATLVTVLFIRKYPHFSEVRIDLCSWLTGTVLIVIVGEMMPKFLARVYPEKTSLIVLPWLSRMRQFVSPLLNLILGPLNFFFPRLNSPPVGQMFTLSMEELKLLLEEDHSASSQDESVSMMHRILGINEHRAEQIMIPIEKVDLVEIDPPGGSVRDRELIIDMIVEEGHTRTPVRWHGELVGFIHSNDLMPSLQFDRREDLTRFIRKHMDVPSDRRVSDLLQDFKTSGVAMGFVKNKNGVVIGIVTLEDVLEEITGEILDEYDVAYPGGKIS